MATIDQSTDDIGARLDRAPITAFHHMLALIVAAGLVVDAIDVYLTASISGALLHLHFANLKQVGYLATATSLGLAFGGLASGVLADRIGRLAMMRWTMILVIIGGIGAALSPSLVALLGWRTLSALGLGGETVLAYGMLSEFVPPSARGRWFAWVALLGCFGLPLSMALAYVLAPAPQGWRWMLAVPAGLGVLVLLLRTQLLESPRWLALRGRKREAEAIVARVEAHARGVLATPVIAAAPQTGRAHIPWRKLSVAATIHIAAICAIFGFVSWLPTFFVASGHTIAASALFSGIMTLGAPTGALISMALTDRIERKWGVVVAALSAAVLGGFYVFASTPAMILGLGFFAVAALYVFVTLGLFSYVPELFVTSIRMAAIGAVSTIGRIVGFSLPFGVTALFALFGQAGIVAALGVVLSVSALVVMGWGDATKGRSIENV